MRREIGPKLVRELGNDNRDSLYARQERVTFGRARLRHDPRPETKLLTFVNPTDRARHMRCRAVGAAVSPVSWFGARWTNAILTNKTSASLQDTKPLSPE